MGATKPRIYKDGDTWSVELPAFGFGRPSVKPGFTTHKKAGEWLAKKYTSTSASIDRASKVHHRWRYDNYPMEIT